MFEYQRGDVPIKVWLDHLLTPRCTDARLLRRLWNALNSFFIFVHGKGDYHGTDMPYMRESVQGLQFTKKNVLLGHLHEGWLRFQDDRSCKPKLPSWTQAMRYMWQKSRSSHEREKLPEMSILDTWVQKSLYWEIALRKNSQKDVGEPFG